MKRLAAVLLVGVFLALALPGTQQLVAQGSWAPVLPQEPASYQWVSIAGSVMENSNNFTSDGCAGVTIDPRHQARAGLHLPDGAVIKWVYLGYKGGDTNAGGGMGALHAFSGSGGDTTLATLVAPPGAVHSGYGSVTTEINHTVNNSENSYVVSYVPVEDMFDGSQEVCYVRIGYIAPTNPSAVSINEVSAKAASILPPGLPPSLLAILAVIAVVSIAWRRPVGRQP